ncbi:MAG: formylglycine-generating enzyme family protein [Deltaproteobacteria bacterium]|nr:formylglycine-generating enzyme family protein [Deltaproteobacteria bacterium]
MMRSRRCVVSLTLCSIMAGGCGGNNGGGSGDAGQDGQDGADAAGDGGVDDGGLDGGTGIKWMPISKGSFVMGTSPDDSCMMLESVQRSVTLTHDFEMAATEVTQGQYRSVMGTNPAKFTACGDDCPVENVTWFMAAAFCNRLSEMSGLASCYDCTGESDATMCVENPAFRQADFYSCPGYRLPTEAEWEYAYRAGSATEFYNGHGDPSLCGCVDINPLVDEIAWYCGNSAVSYAGCDDLTDCGNTGPDGPDCGAACAGPHPAAQKAPNAWGLYDMAGNVEEWCNDWTSAEPASPDPVTDPAGLAIGTYRVFRGGAYSSNPDELRAGTSIGVVPSAGGYIQGFRCVRSLSEP